MGGSAVMVTVAGVTTVSASGAVSVRGGSIVVGGNVETGWAGASGTAGTSTVSSSEIRVPTGGVSSAELLVNLEEVFLLVFFFAMVFLLEGLIVLDLGPGREVFLELGDDLPQQPAQTLEAAAP